MATEHSVKIGAADYERLRALSDVTRVPLAELVRQAVDVYMGLFADEQQTVGKRTDAVLPSSTGFDITRNAALLGVSLGRAARDLVGD